MFLIAAFFVKRLKDCNANKLLFRTFSSFLFSNSSDRRPGTNWSFTNNVISICSLPSDSLLRSCLYCNEVSLLNICNLQDLLTSFLVRFYMFCV